MKEKCKSDYPHALQDMWKALDRAEDLELSLGRTLNSSNDLKQEVLLAGITF